MKTKHRMRHGDVKVANLRDLVNAHGHEQTARVLGEALEEGDLLPESFSLRALAEGLIGADFVARLNPMRMGGLVPLSEAPVDLSAFSAITGQIVFSKILQGWNEADGGVFDALATVVPTSFESERIPGIGKIDLEGQQVEPGMPYPQAGFGQQYVDTPVTTKNGLIVSVTKEAVFFDRTGLVLRNAGTVGDRLSKHRLKRLLRTILGITGGNSYLWNGTSYAMFLSGGSDPYNNLRTGAANVLSDWAAVNGARLQLSQNKDPDTGNPIEVSGPMTLIVPPELGAQARMIVGATSLVTKTNSGNLETGTTINPARDFVSGIVESALMRDLLVASGLTLAQASATWLYGDPKRAVNWMQNWGLTVVQAPSQNPDEFHRDIVAQWKASERGVAAVMEPRVLSKTSAY